MIPLLGKVLNDRYRVEEHIGRGGMAEVYRAFDMQRGVYLALKVLRDDLAEDKIFLRRFEREARTLAALQHPNIVRFYGFERSDGYVYMLMDFIHGKTLRKMIAERDRPFTEQEVIDILNPVCRALHYAHQAGRVHCDVKSANIMVQDDGNVYLTDFGIARGMDAATSTMVGIGTPAYMAPELIRGEDPSPQTDIYALGIMLYEMVTGGERPFTGEGASITGTTAEKVRWEHINLAPPKPLTYDRNYSYHVWNIIERCLQKTKEERYESITNVFEELISEKCFLVDHESSIVDGIEGSIRGSKEKSERKKENQIPKRNHLRAIIIFPVISIFFFIGIFLCNQNSWSFQEQIVLFRKTDENESVLSQLTLTPETEVIGSDFKVKESNDIVDQEIDTSSIYSTNNTVIDNEMMDTQTFLGGGNGELVYSKDDQILIHDIETLEEEVIEVIIDEMNFYCDESKPIWSPTGDNILVSHTCTFIDNEHNVQTTSGLSVVSLLGHPLRTIINNDYSGIQGKSWGNHGNRIYFSSKLGGKNINIVVFDLDDGSTHKITDVQGAALYPFIYDSNKEMLFVTNKNGEYCISSMNLDNSQEDTIFCSNSPILYPQISPDRTMILYEHEINNLHGIYLMNIDGSSIRNLSQNLFQSIEPSWSPDGKWIAFSSNKSDSEFGIYILNIDDHDEVYIGSGRFPSWGVSYEN